MATPGTVYLVGAGPGDPGLITVRGAQILAQADVVIYDGLVGDGMLEIPRADAELLYAGKKRSHGAGPLSQAAICELLVERAQRGLSVVRLKGGDPLIFGRVAEELTALTDAGIDFEIVPGVSALTAAPAYAGIPITRRGVASTVAFATGHAAAGRELSDADFAAFANADTIVLFMAVQALADCAARLIATGRDPATPAAAIHWGTTASQRTLSSTLGDIAAAAATETLKPPALIVIGDVAAPERRFDWRHKRELAGARVLIGRPRGRAAAFATEIAKLGGEPLVSPLTRLVRAEDSIRERSLEHLALPVEWLLFSSASAVEYFVEALLETGRDLRAMAFAQIGCVGESTAKALEQTGLRADLIAKTRSSAGLAEALLELLGGEKPRVLVVRADGGRDDAEIRLGSAGLESEAITLYRSVPANASEPGLARALSRLSSNEIDIVPFFAPSQVSALFSLLPNAKEALEQVRTIAAVGRTTAAALKARDIRVDVIASAPNPVTFAAEIAAAHQKKRTP